MIKDLVHTRVVSTLLIVSCIVVSAGLAGIFLDLFDTAEGAVNEAPVADAGNEPLGGFTSVPLNFNGNQSTDADGEIVSYQWDFGDGYDGIGIKPSHVYYDPGQYLATLTVTDNDGAEGKATIEVSITDDPEGMYQLVTVNEIMTNGTQYFETLIRIENAMVVDDGSYGSGYGSDASGWVKFDVSDTTTSDSVEVYVEGGATRPLDLGYGDLLLINSMLDKYNGAWELHVRVDTPDKVEIMPAVYTNYTLAELFLDKMSHSNELIRCVDLEVKSFTTYGYMVSDNTTNEEVQLYPQANAITPAYVNISDRLTAQGIFAFYDYNQDTIADDDEWEIKVRGTAEDMIVRTYEFDYPPTIANVQHTPAAPSPFAPVTVSADITDNTGVASATLNYAFDGADQTPIAMAGVGNTYSADIPAAVDGTVVTYHINAVDVNSQSINSNTFTYNITDAPPVIVEIVQEPDWVRPTDEAKIYANIFDDSGIVAVTLTYTNDSWATWFNLTILDDGIGNDTVAGDDIFSGNLGSFPEGTTVNYYITANDSIGQTVESEIFEFISSFDQPPQFGGVYRSLEMPMETDSVKIIADVTDDLKMENVTLHYNATGTWVVVNMTLNTDGYYVATIPPQVALTTVEYYVNASDNGSHISTFPEGRSYQYIVEYGSPSIVYLTGHGEMQGEMYDFADVVENMGYYYQEAALEDISLDWVEFLIIVNPDTAYTTAELDTIKTYVQGGGGLMVLGITDYGDYSNSENVNPILEHMGVEGRINDDSMNDDVFCYNLWNASTYTYGADISPHLPYFNFLETNGTFTDRGCFADDTTTITDDVMWIKSKNVCTLYNITTDNVIAKGSEWAFNVDNTAPAPVVSYPQSGGPYNNFPPVLASNDALGGKIVYGGFGNTISDTNYYGWQQSNVTELCEGMIEYLVDTPLLPMPKVDNVVQTPEFNVTSADTVNVRCTVTPTVVEPVIDVVNLLYAVNGSYYVTLEMTDLGGGNYTVDIPAQMAGSVVTYYIQAVDASQNFGFYPTIPEETGIGWYAVLGGANNNILISELAFNPRGTDSDFEFIELYNPMPVALSLEGWWFQLWDGNDNTTDSQSPFGAGKMIPANGYFLIAKGRHTNRDVSLSITMPQNSGALTTGWSIRLFNPDNVIIDRIGYIEVGSSWVMDPEMYEGSPMLVEDKDGSIERLPSNSFEGNYVDTGNNSADWVQIDIENPQSSSSLPEYPPWTQNVTSPFPLPDDHPSKLALIAPTTPETIFSEPEPIDIFEPISIIELEEAEPPVIKESGQPITRTLFIAPMLIIPAALVFSSRRLRK